MDTLTAGSYAQRVFKAPAGACPGSQATCQSARPSHTGREGGDLPSDTQLCPEAKLSASFLGAFKTTFTFQDYVAAVSPKFIYFLKGSPTLPRRPRVRSEGTEGEGQRPRQAREQPPAVSQGSACLAEEGAG